MADKGNNLPGLEQQVCIHCGGCSLSTTTPPSLLTPTTMSHDPQTTLSPPVLPAQNPPKAKRSVSSANATRAPTVMQGSVELAPLGSLLELLLAKGPQATGHYSQPQEDDLHDWRNRPSRAWEARLIGSGPCFLPFHLARKGKCRNEL